MLGVFIVGVGGLICQGQSWPGVQGPSKLTNKHRIRNTALWLQEKYGGPEVQLQRGVGGGGGSRGGRGSPSPL